MLVTILILVMNQIVCLSIVEYETIEFCPSSYINNYNTVVRLIEENRNDGFLLKHFVIN